ncbi:glycosyltransferase family 2 protein [Adlercreutzia shanghongiae]|uniref:Glycosyltransferase family 2 protein n=1 Tax=Adlercreutzia shanghongiae TaxID=3111773 RepID=A0ABU6IXG2_9ACTN|nr:glycosyltransferase family 2 protein [Adlercreutzia sp. R22]MEC4294528.1 glycosyltransferase family 2 protein [Adlercreutzia sp. R22]
MTDIATISNATATRAAVDAACRGEGVAVLVPCYNEAVTIAKVVDDFRAALPEATVYVYDNNSTDDTAAIAAAHGAVVRRETRQGKGNVVRSMFRDIDAEYYLMVDGDDTYPAEAATLLLAPLAADEADMTVGDRISNGAYGKENERPFHNFGNNLVRRLIRLIYGYAFEDVMTGYRAFSRAFVKTMPVMSGGFQIETEISIWAVDRRWRVADVPIDYRDRPAGSESKLSTFTDGALVLAAIASLFRDYKPMAFFGWMGVLLALVGLAFGVPVIGEYLDTGFVSKLPSAVLAVALMLIAALSWTAGLILDTVAKSHRRQWEMSVYRVMEADAER